MFTNDSLNPSCPSSSLPPPRCHTEPNYSPQCLLRSLVFAIFAPILAHTSVWPTLEGGREAGLFEKRLSVTILSIKWNLNNFIAFG